MGKGGIDKKGVKRVRLWSLHPAYLDRMGLVALWREALLAQKVLQEKISGYRNHPQLLRFKESPDPPGLIASYLQEVYLESVRRSYSFTKEKIGVGKTGRLPLQQGQIFFEYQWLKEKLKKRCPSSLRRLPHKQEIIPHPLFYVVEGGREDWEKGRLEGEEHGFS